jgi:bacteriorhodopsin
MATIANAMLPRDTDETDANARRAVRYSFYVTYAFLVTTGTITFIEALRTSDVRARHVLNLETCISVVAAFFYAQFVAKLAEHDEREEPVDYAALTTNRYVDWCITTPIMLLVLLLALAYNSGTRVDVGGFGWVLLFNYAMLLSGYLGETRVVDKRVGNVAGFAAFALLYGFIYARGYVSSASRPFDNQLLFGAFVGLWALYGVAYWMEERAKNVAYNVLDLFSKCFVGIFFWAYFTGALAWTRGGKS